MARRLPLPVVILAGLGLAFVLLPVLAIALRAPWGGAIRRMTDSGAWQALRLSLVVSVAATGISVLVGVPLAWVLARGTFPGRSFVRAAVVLPVVLPPVVGGVGLLAALGREGIVGSWLANGLGVQITFTTTAAIIAAAFVSMPLVVLAVEAGVRALDPRIEGAAAAAGASPWYAFRRVTLPMLRPQLIAGAVLAGARALGEFGATITFAGNLEGRTQTLPLAVYQARQTDPGASLLMSFLLVAVSIGALVVLRERTLGAR